MTTETDAIELVTDPEALASLTTSRLRLAVLAHNGVEFFDVQFACARTGAICVLLNWRLTVSELEYILNDSSPTLLVHDATFADSAAELRARCSISALLEIDGGTPDSAYERALADFDGRPVGRITLTHDDVVTIMYTSGTTGLPKGAMITHGMNFWNCVNLGIPAGRCRATPPAKCSNASCAGSSSVPTARRSRDAHAVRRCRQPADLVTLTQARRRRRHGPARRCTRRA
jgi:acyl-CoA synthetase (AMP-forming)/AMP-acid ligase II